MTLDEKLEQLAGTGDIGFDTKVNDRLGIPAFKMTDGLSEYDGVILLLSLREFPLPLPGIPH